MPGRHLSSRERALAKFWREPPASFEQPLLKGITLQGPPSLRGIRDIHVPFGYPITAICGKNGAGKSTILGSRHFLLGGRPLGVFLRGECRRFARH